MYGSAHLFSTFFSVYTINILSNILQLLEVFWGIEVQDTVKIKKEIKNILLIPKSI